MGLKLELPAEVRRAFATSRASLPGVDPATRFAHENRAMNKAQQDVCVSQAEERRQEAVQDDAGRPRDDVQAQAGRILTGLQVEAKLKKLNPSLIFEDCIAYPERRLIYRREPTVEAGRKLVAAMERGPMPEFSVLDIPKEKWVTPTEFKRGWRTVLGHCIINRVITPTQAVREFGIPTHESANWQKTVC